ncbi:molybdenum cofactor guanylyltransferase [Aurantimonas sp. 22II-16-19i]|uniref:molybdenum cofactor guanylyltransferase n=1 Tax=Aurantimonas sp. 22II-16-19i TaxID=1317114 RepID=UPI0009F7C065|nr:molybdenum cofactor guanylyltransferase [Aurantimonas sp. 22II-16-19i]ORE97808.1 molybdopterin-guanine dinucleotide biosynthesis protein A [Aurantimonas sp. 22II-16-19i]
MKPASPVKPAGLVLAGGRGSRMGGPTPKPLTPLCGRPLVAHVIARLEPQADRIFLAAPRDRGYERFGLTLAPDRRPGLPGPLAGIEAGLAALPARRPGEPERRLLVVPGDTPFLPQDLAERLAQRAGERPVIAVFEGRLQPATGLWPGSLLADLTRWLDTGRPLAIRAFLEEVGFDTAAIDATPDAPAGDPFFNVNTPDDLVTAEAFLHRTSRG